MITKISPRLPWPKLKSNFNNFRAYYFGFRKSQALISDIKSRTSKMVEF